MRLEEAIAAWAKANYDANVGRQDKSSQKSAEITHIETREELAKLAGVSRDTVDKVKAIEAIAARAKAKSGERTDLLQKSVKGPPIHTSEELAKLAGVSPARKIETPV